MASEMYSKVIFIINHSFSTLNKQLDMLDIFCESSFVSVYMISLTIFYTGIFLITVVCLIMLLQKVSDRHSGFRAKPNLTPSGEKKKIEGQIEKKCGYFKSLWSYLLKFAVRT